VVAQPTLLQSVVPPLTAVEVVAGVSSSSAAAAAGAANTVGGLDAGHTLFVPGVGGVAQ